MNIPLRDPRTDASTNAREATPPPTRSIRVWDVPVRLVHWLLVLSFAGAWLTAESERWRDVHVLFGYTMAGLAAFRVLWGFVGSSHARFSSFVRGPSAVLTYLKGLASGNPAHFVGHNPAGALAIVALLALITLTAASGWATLNGWGGKWFEEAHELIAHVLFAVVVVHVLGVVASSVLHRENLVRSMLTGRKQVTDSAPAASTSVPRRAILATVVLLGVVTFWAWQLTSPSVTVAAHQATATSKAAGHSSHDDD